MRLMIFVGLGLAATALTTPSAHAQFFTGTKLLLSCETNTPTQLLTCITYIEAVADGVVGDLLGEELLLSKGRYPEEPCFRPGISGEQLRLIVVNALRSRPENLDRPAAILVHNALFQAFPPPKDRDPRGCM